MNRLLALCREICGAAQLYPCSGDAQLVRMEPTKPRDFEQLAEALGKQGFVCYRQSREGENAFALFYGQTHNLYLSYSPFEACTRLVCEPSAPLPPCESETPETPVPVLLTQIRPAYFGVDCGMCYLLRLADGRFVVFDGCEGEYDEVDHLMDLLRSQNTRAGKPCIAAWFITHAHSDHFGGFVGLMDKYADRVTLERLVYNWSLPEMTCATSPLEDFDRVCRNLTDTAVITARSGQRFCFAGADIDVLYACEDLYPTHIRTLNDTSLVLRVGIGKRRVLFLGDCMEQSAAYICRRYPAETLKCELLQVGHHGYWGGSYELYKAADPQVLLWPCPDFWYQEIKNWDCNRFLRESGNIRRVIITGREEAVLDMSLPIPTVDPYDNKGSEVLYSQDFSDTTLLGLRACCITGGKTGYQPLSLAFLRQGACALSAGNALSVCEWVQPEMTAHAAVYEFVMRGRLAEPYERIGLLFNHPHPTVWSERKALWLSLPVGEDWEIRLTVNTVTHRAELFCDGKSVRDMLFVAQDSPCGIYLVMKKANVTLYSVGCRRLEYAQP